jgi:hypothetical protein
MNRDLQHRVLTSEMARHLRLIRNSLHSNLAIDAKALANNAKLNFVHVAGLLAHSARNLAYFASDKGASGAQQ